MADDLTTVTDNNLRKTLTMFRLSDHRLAIEKVRHRQTWLSREDRLCFHCYEGAVETELHFLSENQNYRNIREELFPKFDKKLPQLPKSDRKGEISPDSGGKEECAVLLNMSLLATTSRT